MDTKFNIYLKGDTSKTIALTHPKLDASADDFEDATDRLALAYNVPYDYTGLVSETVVHAAS